MKLHFLGTGAADWDIKNPSTDINFRRFSSLLIDEVLLIDPGPCVYEFAESFGYPNLTSGIKYVVNTHSHGDHYNAETLEKLCGGGAEFIKLEAGAAPVCIGGYRLVALAANHGTCADAVHITVESEKDGKRMFYGCDGSWLPYQTYRAIAETHFNLMIFDCTVGDKEGDFRIFEHNNIRMVEEMVHTLRPYSDAFMVSHMARTLHDTHAQLVKRLEKSQIKPAHDNLIITI